MFKQMNRAYTQIETDADGNVTSVSQAVYGEGGITGDASGNVVQNAAGNEAQSAGVDAETKAADKTADPAPEGERAKSIDTATGREAAPELSSERVKEIFSTISKKYERFNAVSSFGAYKIWLADVVRQAPVGPDSDVLDIAGGTGDVTFAIARGKHPKHIQCTDLVNDMLDVARAHYAQGAADGVPVDFAVVDAQDIPYPDNSYDVVTVAYGLRNMPKREQALSEMFRVLKPGGTLVCLEFSQPQNPAWHKLYEFYLTHMIPFWGGLITGDRDGFVYLQSSIKAFPDQKSFAKMFEDAGFTNVTWKNHTGGIAAIHVARKPE
jgi:demethylmenaquinone methyltransferase / 2-methoxy-6-polyprenyl-1,4-benzoquinol methylase